MIGISTYYTNLRELIRFLETDSEILGVALTTQVGPPRPSKTPQRAPVPPPEEFDSIENDEDHEDQPW